MVYSVLFALRLEEVLLMGTFPVANSIAIQFLNLKQDERARLQLFFFFFFFYYVLDTLISVGHDGRSLNDLCNIMAKKN
jgi:hypothetical protein